MMRLRPSVRVLLCACLALCGCEGSGPELAQKTPNPASVVAPLEEDEVPIEPTEPAPDWLDEISTEADWRRLAAPSNEHAIARTEVVKVLWDHATDRLYFCQSARWPIHYDFAVRFIASATRPLGDRRTFNRRQYLRADREMQMASLVRYRDGDLWAVELGPADSLSGDGIAALFQRIGPHVFFGDQLQFRPRSGIHRRHIADVRGALRVLDPNVVWTGVRYQPVTLGDTVGRLRFVEGPIDPGSVVPDQILVLDHVPDDIPLCAGIVTSEIQAPLAHVAVLSQSRGTPNMALRGVFQDGQLRALDGTIVRLEVGAGEYTVEPATPDALRRALRTRRPATLSPPTLDVATNAIANVCELRLDDAPWAGAKAAQLGEVCGAGLPTPGGFVVPAHHYRAHLSRHAIDATARTLRDTPRFDADGRAREAALGALRERIERPAVEARLVREIASRIRAHRHTRWIFRSSTNAEDLPGFSGAGLYASAVTGADPDDAAIEDALRTVWASVWTRRAWDERDYYGLDHDAVGMAVLVQPFVSDPVAMGVAITENPFSTQRSGILVNLAPPGGSVTAAREALPEQVLLYRHSRPELLSLATGHEDRPLLSSRAMRPLRERLDQVHTHMMALWGERADAADVEFALLRDGTAIILQARPYRMRR